MSRYQISITDTGLAFKANREDTILCAMLRAGIGVPYECNAGGCGSCKYTLNEGKVIDDMSDTTGLKPRDKRKNKHLACISHAQSECNITIKLDKNYQPSIVPSRTVAVFVSKQSLTRDFWEFCFKSEGPATFLPGQYAKVGIPGVVGPRSFSMSNTANSEGIWSFQVKKVDKGAASSVLFEQSLEGLPVIIDAPYSIAHLQEHSSRPIVCIAGGSGLAPMVSIIRGVAKQEKMVQLPMLYHGVRTEHDIVEPSYFPGIRGFDPNTQYVPIVSEPTSNTGWPGTATLVHEYIAKNFPEEIGQTDFYLAGPPLMVDAVRRFLILDRGVSVNHLHYDRFF